MDKTPAIAPTDHHPHGPSSWPAKLECVLFESEGNATIEDLDVAAVLTEEERGKEDAKQMGTRLHAALAKVLRRIADPLDGLSEREREQVVWVATQIHEIAAMHGYQAEELTVEERVTMFEGESFSVLYFGTLDAGAGPAIIFDAKFGDPRNYFPQMVGYMLPRMVEHGFSRGFAYLLYGRWRKTVSHIIDRETAETVTYGLLRRMASPDKRPSVNQYCGWCAKRATCSAFTQPIIELNDRRDDWLLKLTNAHVSRIGMDPVQAGLARWLWKYHLEPWGSAVEFLTSSMAGNGLVPVGFKTQPQKGGKVIQDGARAICALMDAGVPDEAANKAVSVSFGGLVEVYHEAMGGTEAAAVRAVEKILLDAKLLTYGNPIVKLVKLPGGDELLRTALARVPVPSRLTGQDTTPTSEVPRIAAGA